MIPSDPDLRGIATETNAETVHHPNTMISNTDHFSHHFLRFRCFAEKTEYLLDPFCSKTDRAMRLKHSVAD